MYLKALVGEEKQAFLELAYLAARADRILAVEELALWRTFRFELQLPDDRYSVRELPLAQAAAFFKSDRSKRVALIELARMVLADGVQTPEEHGFLNQLAEAFGLDKPFLVRCVEWVQRYAVIVAEGAELSDGDPAREKSPAA